VTACNYVEIACKTQHGQQSVHHHGLPIGDNNAHATRAHFEPPVTHHTLRKRKKLPASPPSISCTTYRC